MLHSDGQMTSSMARHSFCVTSSCTETVPPALRSAPHVISRLIFAPTWSSDSSRSKSSGPAVRGLDQRQTTTQRAPSPSCRTECGVAHSRNELKSWSGKDAFSVRISVINVFRFDASVNGPTGDVPGALPGEEPSASSDANSSR